VITFTYSKFGENWDIFGYHNPLQSGFEYNYHHLIVLYRLTRLLHEINKKYFFQPQA